MEAIPGATLVFGSLLVRLAFICSLNLFHSHAVLAVMTGVLNETSQQRAYWRQHLAKASGILWQLQASSVFEFYFTLKFYIFYFVFNLI
jgi:hypothetical protein